MILMLHLLQVSKTLLTKYRMMPSYISLILVNPLQMLNLDKKLTVNQTFLPLIHHFPLLCRIFKILLFPLLLRTLISTPIYLLFLLVFIPNFLPFLLVYNPLFLWLHMDIIPHPRFSFQLALMKDKCLQAN